VKRRCRRASAKVAADTSIVVQSFDDRSQASSPAALCTHGTIARPPHGVRAGTLVDAALIPSASIRGDGEAKWAGHRRRKPVHGYKAHVATDEGAGLVRGVEVTTADAHDAAGLERVLPPEPGDAYGDSAFTGGAAERVIIGRGGRPHTVWTGIWGRGPEALGRLEVHNAAVRRVRCRIEKVFGTWKRSYGLRRMRWLGLAKAGLQVTLGQTAPKM